MSQTISKSQLKPYLLDYLRKVQKEKQRLIITHYGKPVVEITPYTKTKNKNQVLRKLRNSVVEYKNPTEPIGEKNWKALK